jgi:hypothetical protein
MCISVHFSCLYQNKVVPFQSIPHKALFYHERFAKRLAYGL